MVDCLQRGSGDDSGHGTGRADAVIERVFVQPGQQGQERADTLLNPMHAPRGSTMRLLADVLTRVEALSHCLFWRSAGNKTLEPGTVAGAPTD